jgi:hypothetical protein
MFAAAVAAVLLMSGGFNVLLSFFSVAEWIFYGLAASTIFVLRWREPELDRPFRSLRLIVINLTDLLLQRVAPDPLPLLPRCPGTRGVLVCAAASRFERVGGLHPIGCSGSLSCHIHTPPSLRHDRYSISRRSTGGLQPDAVWETRPLMSSSKIQLTSGDTCSPESRQTSSDDRCGCVHFL